MANRFPLIEVEGQARERGFQYGRKAGEQISAGLSHYSQSFANAGISWEEATDLAKDFCPRIEAFDPEYLVEMQAIAKGAEQPLEHITILNARTELIFWNNKTQPSVEIETDECTAALALPEMTANGHLIQGQNWDWHPRCEESAVVLLIRNNEGPDILTFVEAGQLARSGMNSDGVALTANGLHSNQDYGRMGVPNPFIRRRLLSQSRLAPAMSAITQASISFSHFLLLSHSGGEAVGFEATPDNVFWMQAEKGILTHANHFKIPAALANITDVGVLRTPESIYRDSRVATLLATQAGQITVDSFKRAFADEYGKPDSVLRYPAARPGGNLSATVASIIMDTTDKVMWIAPSPFKGTEYTQYTFGDQ